MSLADENAVELDVELLVLDSVDSGTVLPSSDTTVASGICPSDLKSDMSDKSSGSLEVTGTGITLVSSRFSFSLNETSSTEVLACTGGAVDNVTQSATVITCASDDMSDDKSID